MTPIISDDIIIHLPWPPSLNTYYARTRNGVFISGKGRIFRKKVIESISEQIAGHHIYKDTRLLLEVKLFPPDNRARDLDNHMKGLLDAIEHSGLIENDSQIDQLFIYRGTIIRGGTCIVEISEAGPILESPCLS